MKRTHLILLAFFSLALSLGDSASAKLYEARLMGVDVERVEIGDVEDAKMCLPVEEQLDEEEIDLAPEEIDTPAPSGPLL